jgi:uncharacterized protein YkwD
VKTWIRGCVCAVVCATVQFVAGAQTAVPWQDEWLTRFTRERERIGARPLLPSPVLNQVAQQQAEEMARDGWHTRSPSAKAIEERLQRVGYSAHSWRESYVLAMPAARPASREVRSKALLDGSFRDLGVGTAVANGSTIHVFLFGWHKGDFFARATAGLMDKARVQAEMLSGVNDARRRSGLPPLAPNPLLDRVSQEHAEDMLRRSYFGHRTPEGLGPSDRARADGYRSGIGENIVEQRFSTKEALEAWLDSPGHRKNILDPSCREMGLGLAVGEGYDAAPGGYRVIWVQSFGSGR